MKFGVLTFLMLSLLVIAVLAMLLGAASPVRADPQDPAMVAQIRGTPEPGLPIIRVTLAPGMLAPLVALPPKPTPMIQLPCVSRGMPVEYGRQFESEIWEPGTQCVYAFVGQAGDIVTLAMNRIGEGLDPYLELIDPDGKVEARDDDSGGNLSSLIVTHVLRLNGTYNIIARDQRNQNKGRFNLRVWAGGPPTAAEQPPSGCGKTIRYGSLQMGEVTRGASECYAFEGVEGELLVVAMGRIAGDLDPTLEIVGPNGTTLISKTAGQNGLIQIYGLKPPTRGTYYILAGSYQGRSAGKFGLMLGRYICGGAVAYGQEVSAHAPPGEPCLYTFWGRSGDTVGLELKRAAGVLRPHMELLTPLKATIRSSDSDDRSVIEGYRLLADGMYGIEVKAQSENETGVFTLTLWKESCGGPLAFGDTVHAEIAEMTRNCRYTFKAESGQYIKVAMLATSGNLVPQFLILDPDGVALSGVPNQYEGQAGRKGTYTIIAGGQGSTAGRFTLQLRTQIVYPVAAPTCGRANLAPGTRITEDLKRAGDRCVYTFSASANDVVTIVMNRMDSFLGLPVMTYEPGDPLDPYLWLHEGDSTVSPKTDDDSAGNHDSMIARYTLPKSGIYRIEAGSYRDRSTGRFHLSYWFLH